MILKKNEPTFVTSDGQKFLDLNDAEAHQISLDLTKICDNSAHPVDIRLSDLIDFVQLHRAELRFMFDQLRVS